MRHKKYLIHDEQNQLSVGDAVKAVACRPLSARKHFTFLARVGGADAGAERRARAEKIMGAEERERIRIEALVKEQRALEKSRQPGGAASSKRS